jgi:hypothetical protein
VAISINNLVDDMREFEGNLVSKFSVLWNTLLDDDNGISRESYDRLAILGNIIDPNFVRNVNYNIIFTEERCYNNRG